MLLNILQYIEQQTTKQMRQSKILVLRLRNPELDEQILENYFGQSLFIQHTHTQILFILLACSGSYLGTGLSNFY